MMNLGAILTNNSSVHYSPRKSRGTIGLYTVIITTMHCAFNDFHPCVTICLTATQRCRISILLRARGSSVLVAHSASGSEPYTSVSMVPQTSECHCDSMPGVAALCVSRLRRHWNHVSYYVLVIFTCVAFADFSLDLLSGVTSTM